VRRSWAATELDREAATLIAAQAEQIAALTAERDRLRKGYRDIQFAAEDGRICDDVAWFDTITTLYDFCETMLDRQEPAMADMFARAALASAQTGEG